MKKKFNMLMPLKKTYLRFTLLLLFVLPFHLMAQRKFIHPGLTYTQSDLDRMKAMVVAKQEPYYSTYKQLLQSSYSQIGNGNYSEITQIKEGAFNGTIGADGRRAHDLALLYHITGNRAYADDAVKRINRYKNLTNASTRGTAPLDNGKIYMLIEAAELLRNYDGWATEDQQAFKKMLTHPFYSSTTTAEGYKNINDDLNNVSFYWNIYQFDQGRFGNQGLFAARGLLAMGVYLDNDKIYDRAYRYLGNLPSRTDDLPYPSSTPIQGSLISTNDFIKDFNVSWQANGTNEYHSDEVLGYYIYKNGQSQESNRDQGHTMGGLGTYTAVAEIAWSQGDNIYGWLDNRILLGIEYNTRYNLSAVKSYLDQPLKWEPTAFSKNEEECTYDNGVFYQATSRSKRWEAIWISPDGRGSSVTGSGGWRTQVLQHYKTRLGLSSDKTLWLQRSYDDMIERYGHENWGVAPNWYYEWTGWGTLTKFRTDWMAGDPGTWVNGERISGMPVAPCTIKAIDYDFFPQNGQGRTYNDLSLGNRNTLYRYDSDVDIEVCSEGGFNLTDLEQGEWLNYTVSVPKSGFYKLKIRYASINSDGKIRVEFDGSDVTGNVSIPHGGINSNGGQDWKDLVIGQEIKLQSGAKSMRVFVEGKTASFKLLNITIEEVETALVPDVPSGLGFKLGHKQTLLSWQESIGATIYNIKRSLTSFGPYVEIGASVNADFKDVDVTNGTTYYYKVIAGNNIGLSAESEILEVFVGNRITGNLIGTPGSYQGNANTTIAAAVDENLATFFDSNVSNNSWLGYDLGEGNKARIKLVNFVPRTSHPQRMLNGRFEGANNSDFSDAVVLFTVSSQPLINEWTSGEVSSTDSYRYIRYISGTGTNGNVSEIEFIGVLNPSPRIAQTISFTNFGTKVLNEDVFSLEATASSGLEVKYRSSNPEVAMIFNNQVKLINVGNSTISAYQSGDDIWSAAPEVTQELVVGKMAQTINLNSMPEVNLITQDFFPDVTTSSGLNVELTSSNINVATIANGKIHITGPGKTIITASQSGDEKWLPALQVTQILVVEAIFPRDNFTISIKNETCSDKNNGIIKITSKVNLNFKAILSGSESGEFPFTNDLEIPSLKAGVYKVCLTVIEDAGFQQCFDLTISEPQPLSVYASLNQQDQKVLLHLSGGENYQIELNGKVFQEKSGSVTLNLQKGENKLSVIADKECQGVFVKNVFIDEAKSIYPNPFNQTFYITMNNDFSASALITISSLNGETLYKKEHQQEAGIITINAKEFNIGTYVLQIKTPLAENNLKIVKK